LKRCRIASVRRLSASWKLPLVIVVMRRAPARRTPHAAAVPNPRPRAPL
jgi:hypothetical protein